MENLQIIIGIGIGVAIAFAIWKFLQPKEASNTRDWEFELQEKTRTLQESEISKARVESELEASKAQIHHLTSQNNALTESKDRLLQENATLANEIENLRSKQKEITDVQEKFSKEFQLIASQLMEKNAKSFNETSQQSLKSILDPLKEKIGSFEKEINEKYVAEAKDKATLKEQISNLVNLNTKLSDDANNLTKALTGSNKHQGNWGEVMLERVLERSGLEKDSEYRVQAHIQTEDGARRYPDAVVFLPDDKHIIIDSKVSLTAYQRMVNAESEDDRLRQLKLHVTSLKNHIKSLGEKNYFDTEAFNSPDFILMFLPIEASFSVALREDPELFNFAWERNIVIVSPTTLLATLRTIASTWKHEKQTRHVLDIAKEGGALYDKFVSFVEDLQKIEKGLHSSQTAYDAAFNKLKSGKGNIISRTEKLKVLGAKAKKSISNDLLDESGQLSIETEIDA